MSAANKEDDDPFGLLDGTEPVEETEDETEEVEAPAPDEPEPEDDSAAEPGEEDPESAPTATPEETPPDVAAEEPGEDVPPDDTPQAPTAEERLAEADRRAHALQQALAKQRKENRVLRMESQAYQAPNPGGDPHWGSAPSPGVIPPQPPQPGQVPVEAPQQTPQGYGVDVSPDGSSVYVNREPIRQDVQQIIAQQQAEFLESQNENMERAFMARDPDTHTPIIQEAHAANEFVGGALQNAILSGEIAVPPGATPEQALTAIVDHLELSGVVEQVKQFFPHVGGNFRPFFAAWASQDPFAKRDVLSDMVGAGVAPAPSNEPPTEQRRKVESVADAPRSLAGKGGARPAAEQDDEREFRSLYGRFTDEPGRFSEEDHTRMTELGKKLGKETFDD